MKIQCCVCKSFQEGDQWLAPKPDEPELDAPESEQLSHGYCPSCADDAFREIREYKRYYLPNAPARRPNLG